MGAMPHFERGPLPPSWNSPYPVPVTQQRIRSRSQGPTHQKGSSPQREMVYPMRCPGFGPAERNRNPRVGQGGHHGPGVARHVGDHGRVHGHVKLPAEASPPLGEGDHLLGPAEPGELVAVERVQVHPSRFPRPPSNRARFRRVRPGEVGIHGPEHLGVPLEPGVLGIIRRGVDEVEGQVDVGPLLGLHRGLGIGVARYPRGSRGRRYTTQSRTGSAFTEPSLTSFPSTSTRIRISAGRCQHGVAELDPVPTRLDAAGHRFGIPPRSPSPPSPPP